MALLWKAWVPAAVCCSFSELVHPTAQARLVVLAGEIGRDPFHSVGSACPGKIETKLVRRRVG